MGAQAACQQEQPEQPAKVMPLVDWLTQPKLCIHMSDSESIAQLIDLLKNDSSEQFSVAWVQRKLRAGYNKACSIRDQMIDQGLIEKVQRTTFSGDIAFFYVLAGEMPKDRQQWLEVQKNRVLNLNSPSRKTKMIIQGESLLF